MSTAYLKQPTNVVAIQQAILNIILGDSSYSFKSSGLNRVPTAAELQPVRMTATITSVNGAVIQLPTGPDSSLVDGASVTLHGTSDVAGVVQSIDTVHHTVTLTASVSRSGYTQLVWMGSKQLPGAYVLKPDSADKRSAIPGTVFHDWEFPVHLIWPYRIPDELNDALLTQAEADFTDLFDSNYDLQGTCAPTAQAMSFKVVYWADVDNSAKVQWISLAFCVCAHEDLDRQHLPPL